MMLAELHVKEYEKPHVHTVKKMKHNDNHHIKEHKHIHIAVHPVWVTFPGLGIKIREVASLNAAR